LIRLKFGGVFGSNPEKIQVAGTIDTVCFDKTGTLTTLNLKVWGHWFGEVRHSTGKESRSSMEWKIMGCCHHLTRVGSEMLGDPLEIEMVAYSGYNICFEGKFFKAVFGSESLTVISIFEFSSEQ
jgi:cation-transporting ATPase 13A3/4/5